MRDHWRELDYWRWLWYHKTPTLGKLAVGGLLLVLLLGGGWFAADRLTSANAGVPSSRDLLLETTVQKLVTVRERGKVVRKLVPVVKRVYRRGQTIYHYQLRTNYRTQVLTMPGAVHVVSHVVTTRTVVPIVKKQVVTVNGAFSQGVAVGEPP